MSVWWALAWFVPALLCISIVVGAAGHEGAADIRRSIARTFRSFFLGVLMLGLCIHLLARVFA